MSTSWLAFLAFTLFEPFPSEQDEEFDDDDESELLLLLSEEEEVDGVCEDLHLFGCVALCVKLSRRLSSVEIDERFELLAC